MPNERLTRYFTLAIGAVYVVVGIAGLIPVFHTSPAASAPHVDATADYGYLLGLFPVNVFHDALNLVIGVAGIACAQRFASARLYCRILFLFFAVLTFMGFIPQLETVFGLIPIFGNDIPLHGITSLVAGIVGFVIAEENVEPQPAH